VKIIHALALWAAGWFTEARQTYAAVHTLVCTDEEGSENTSSLGDHIVSLALKLQPSTLRNGLSRLLHRKAYIGCVEIGQLQTNGKDKPVWLLTAMSCLGWLSVGYLVAVVICLFYHLHNPGDRPMPIFDWLWMIFSK